MRLNSITGIILIILFLGGCTLATKQKVRKIFFDGVPDWGERAQLQGKEKEKARSLAEYRDDDKSAAVSAAAETGSSFSKSANYSHLPFVEGECSACHRGEFSQSLNAEGKELCFSCHDDFLEGAEVKHFPAEEGMCLECHSPHRSKNKFLLVRTGQDLCLECHDKEEIIAREPHGEIGGESCVNCHDPHKGEEALLR